MTTLTIALPDTLDAFVNSEAAKEGHADAAEYIVSLLREQQKAKVRAELEQKLLEAVEALDRGEGKEITPADWAELCQRISDKYRAQATR